MIVVALGTEQFPFTRLLNWVDQAITDGHIPAEEEVFIQAGKTAYESRHKSVKIVSLLPFQELYRKYGEARINIIHAGIGTLLDVIEQGNPVIVVPRDPEQKEHIDKHQLQFTELARNKLGITICNTYEDFAKALAVTTQKVEIHSTRNSLVEFLKSQI